MIKNFKTLGEVTTIFFERTDGKIFEVLIDTEDFEKLHKFPNSWYISNSGDERFIYAVSNTPRPNRKRVYMHRLILDAPKGLVVDHINHNTLDNRKSNLRAATKSLNGLNRKCANPNNEIGLRGVQYDKRNNFYYARAFVDGEFKYLGCFKCKHEAKEKVDKFLKRIGV